MKFDASLKPYTVRSGPNTTSGSNQVVPTFLEIWGNGSRGPTDHEPDDSWCFDEYEDVLSPPPTEHTSSDHENLFPDQPEFVVQDSGEPSTSRKIIKATVLRVPQPTIIPTDPYEACTPAYRTILHGDDANDLSFIPFADDPRFDGKAYAAEYKRFAWQERHSTPDGMAHLFCFLWHWFTFSSQMALPRNGATRTFCARYKSGRY